MDKTRQWSVMTVLAVLAVMAAGWFLLVSPQRSEAASLRQQADTQRQSNAMLQTKVNMLRQQAKDLPKQQARLAQIAAKMPDNPALPPLIRSLSDAADRAGVDLVSLAPLQPQLMTASVAAPGASAGAAGATGAAAAPAAALATIPLTIEVQGGYFNVEQFMAAVEDLKRAMLVTGLQIVAVDGSATSSGGSTSGAKQVAPGTLRASIKAQVFMVPSATMTPTKPVAPAATSK